MRYAGAEKNYLVAASCLHNVGPVSMRKILHASVHSKIDISDICRFSAIELKNEVGLNAAAANELAGMRFPLERGREVGEQVESRGARVLFDDEQDYPDSLTQCLGRAAPLLLFVGGSVGLLRSRAVGIVGSRRPSPRAADAARGFAARLAGRGWIVVSGAAAGIDSCGHCGALEAGCTVFLPPKGIFRFRWDPMPAGMPDEESWCVASPFPPFADWETKHALIRNGMITALSRAVVAFEPRDRGGTWHSANRALQMGKPLFVVPFSKSRSCLAGSEKLARRGASIIDCDRMPAGDEFEAMLREYNPPPQKSPEPLF